MLGSSRSRGPFIAYKEVVFHPNHKKKPEGKKALSCKQQVNWLLRTIATMEQVSCLRLLEIVPKDLLPNTEGQCIIIHLTVRAATL